MMSGTPPPFIWKNCGSRQECEWHHDAELKVDDLGQAGLAGKGAPRRVLGEAVGAARLHSVSPQARFLRWRLGSEAAQTELVSPTFLGHACFRAFIDRHDRSRVQCQH